MNVVLVFMVLLAVILVDAQSEWPKRCNKYSRHNGLAPSIDTFEILYGMSKAECRNTCTGRAECGGFVVLKLGEESECLLYALNDQIIGDHLGENWYTPLSLGKWYSKTCPYELAQDTDLQCNDYSSSVHHNRYIAGPEWVLAGGTTLGIRHLTAAQCQQWCTLYARCASVSHVHSRVEGKSQCQMFTTTIPELLTAEAAEPGAEDIGEYVYPQHDLYNITTYDRHCLTNVKYNARSPTG